MYNRCTIIYKYLKNFIIIYTVYDYLAGSCMIQVQFGLYSIREDSNISEAMRINNDALQEVETVFGTPVSS